mmetsp:Transcript_138446/g.239337  ORF Transcript_138446/g.239337 Transcript_138446/m.239337 type:complete len:88 (+) Transcript_138446:10-273(+)
MYILVHNTPFPGKTVRIDLSATELSQLLSQWGEFAKQKACKNLLSRSFRRALFCSGALAERTLGEVLHINIGIVLKLLQRWLDDRVD